MGWLWAEHGTKTPDKRIQPVLHRTKICMSLAGRRCKHIQFWARMAISWLPLGLPGSYFPRNYKKKGLLYQMLPTNLLYHRRFVIHSLSVKIVRENSPSKNAANVLLMAQRGSHFKVLYFKCSNRNFLAENHHQLVLCSLYSKSEITTSRIL